MIRFYFHNFSSHLPSFPFCSNNGHMRIATGALTNETKVVLSEDWHFSFYYLDGQLHCLPGNTRDHAALWEEGNLAEGAWCFKTRVSRPSPKRMQSSCVLWGRQHFHLVATFLGEKTHLDCGPRGLVLDTMVFGNVLLYKGGCGHYFDFIVNHVQPFMERIFPNGCGLLSSR